MSLDRTHPLQFVLPPPGVSTKEGIPDVLLQVLDLSTIKALMESVGATINMHSHYVGWYGVNDHSFAVGAFNMSCYIGCPDVQMDPVKQHWGFMRIEKEVNETVSKSVFEILVSNKIRTELEYWLRSIHSRLWGWAPDANPLSWHDPKHVRHRPFVAGERRAKEPPRGIETPVLVLLDDL